MPSGKVLAALAFGRAIGVEAGGQNGWWHTTHYAERVLQARAYGHTLNETAAMLPDLKARGYSVINLDWPVMSGPVNLYGGFGPKDYYHVEPLIGTDEDWLNFVKAAHDLDLKVVSWFNPSYFWTGATAFKAAEADIVQYGVDRDSLPVDSPARWFRWADDSSEGCSNDIMKPRDEDAESYYNGDTGGPRWVKDPDASGACYWSVFSDQPSGDLTIPEWREEVKRIFKHWVDTGIDGFILDAPYDYVGVGPPWAGLDARLIREVIIDPVHLMSNGQVAVFGEEYCAKEPDVATSLDGSIVGTWCEDGNGLRKLDVAALIRAESGDDLEPMLQTVDFLHRTGSVARSRPDFCPDNTNYDESVDELAANVLQAATVAMLGGYYEMMSTCQDDIGVGIGDFGDYELWAGEAQVAPVLHAMRRYVPPSTPRHRLQVNSSGAYAALRGSSCIGCTPALAALVLLNFQNSPQTLKVELPLTADIGDSRDLLTGEVGPRVARTTSHPYFEVTLPALGFGLYGIPVGGPPSGAQIQSRFSGLCVDLASGNTSNGALLQTWQCDGGDTQEWVFQDGQLVYSSDPSKCVDLLGGNTTNGNMLGIWDCYQGDSQMWGFDSEMGTVYLASTAASDATKCAQIGGENSGDPVVIWDCNIEPEQMWTVGSLQPSIALV